MPAALGQRSQMKIDVAAAFPGAQDFCRVVARIGILCGVLQQFHGGQGVEAGSLPLSGSIGFLKRIAAQGTQRGVGNVSPNDGVEIITRTVIGLNLIDVARRIRVQIRKIGNDGRIGSLLCFGLAGRKTGQAASEQKQTAGMAHQVSGISLEFER